jgi:hypothetical protein
LKTPNGAEPIAKFYLGENGKSAYSIFKKLHGAKLVSEKDIIEFIIVIILKIEFCMRTDYSTVQNLFSLLIDWLKKCVK